MHADVGDDASVGVEHRIEDERPERCGRIAGGWRHLLHHRLQELLHALAGLRRDPEDVLRVDVEEVRQLLRPQLRLRRRQVDLVQGRDDREARVPREVEVRERLRLQALGRVDEQDRALASLERTGHLIGEVDVARRVDQVQLVPLVGEPDRLRFDRDPALALQVHAVQVLRPHVAVRHGVGELQQPVGQGRLPVVDVRHDAEVPDVRDVHEASMVRGGSFAPCLGKTLRMRYVALACDYDGTIAHDGAVPDGVVEAMVRLKESGRRLLLVTGRELDDLGEAFGRIEIFDRVVAENGALLFDPATRDVRALAEPPPEAFVEALRSKGVEPLSVGRVIVATWEPHQEAVLQAIHELGLELQVIFNKGAVMVLPALVNKASGVHAALEELGLSPHNVVGVGDAENDHAFLDLCELSVAVDNALPVVKEHCDHVTEGSHGEGVTELIEAVLEDDLEELDERVRRHDIPIGTRGEEEPLLIRPYRTNVLITGPSGSGKSTLTTAILEQLAGRGYQFCLIDPEGDYDDLEGVVVLGSAERAPTVDEALDVLAAPGSNLVLNLLGVRLDDRPGFLDKLLPRLQERRTATGRPHWLVIDEAHHLLPAGLQTAEMSMPRDVASLVLVTVHADAMAPDALKPVNVVLTPGKGAGETLQVFAKTAGVDRDVPGDIAADDDDAVCWFVGDDPFVYRPIQPTADLKRHRRKYAEGDLEEDAFYFTGPDDRLHLRVQNLVLFAQIAEGIDDETWTWHLQRGDYEKWFRDAIGDDDLADLADELADHHDPEETRRRILEAIEEKYTRPAEATT